MSKVILVTLYVILSYMLFSFCMIPGCAVLRPISDAIFGTETEETTIPDTPKEQLWETIKGMIPNWMAIPVIAMGGVVMWYGSFKLGMAFVIFGSINLFLALATSRFGYWMALCGFIGTIAALVSAMLAKNKALRELIFNNQCIKQVAKDDNVDLVFQDKIKERLAKQVKSTKKIVKKIKNSLRLKGEI